MADRAPYRTVHVKLPLELIDALQAMGRSCWPLPRKLSNTIETALLWAIWAHSHGRGPDAEMTRLEGGYTQWNENIATVERKRTHAERIKEMLARPNKKLRARREIDDLERLFSLDEPREPAGSQDT